MQALKKLFAILAAATVLLTWRISGKVEVPGRRPPRTLREALVVVPPEAPPLDHALTVQQPPALHDDEAVPPRAEAPSEAPSSTAPLVTAAALDPGDAHSSDCWLVFGIPTLPRSTGEDYLNLTLESLLCQLPASPPPEGRICIAVYDVRPTASAGSPFARAEQLLRSRRAHPDVRFVRAPSASQQREVEVPARRGSGGTAKTRRQTSDVATMLRTLAPLARSYFVLMEDDWLLCEGGWAALRYLVGKANAYSAHPAGIGWSALRFSYGLNGILLRAADVAPFATFLRDPAAAADNALPDAPVDHLAYRWLRGKYELSRAHFGRRRIVAFRHTLFWHVGGTSAVGNSKSRHQPRCYTQQSEWLFEQEKFHDAQCPDDDVWPCDTRPPANSSAAAEVRRLAAAAVERGAGGARVCGPWRVCWQRPDGEASGAARRCARRLLCGDVAATPGAPCTSMTPEYRDWSAEAT